MTESTYVSLLLEVYGLNLPGLTEDDAKHLYEKVENIASKHYANSYNDGADDNY